MKKLLALATSVALTFTLAISAAADTVIFDSGDAGDEYQAFLDNEGGATGGGTYLTKAGDPSFNAYDGKIVVNDRVNDWDSADFKLGSLEVGKTYILEVTFSSKEPATFAIVDADGPYQNLVTSDAGITEATLKYEFTTIAGSGDTPVLSEESSQNRLRIREETKTGYTIEHITLYEAGGAAAVDTTDDTAATDDTAEADDTSAAAPATGSTAAPASSDKGSADTGVEGIAVVAGLALVATGAVVISRKRK